MSTDSSIETFSKNSINETRKSTEPIDAVSQVGESDAPLKLTEQNQKLQRTDSKLRDKQIRSLFNKLFEANEKGNSEEANNVFIDMEKLDSRHEKVFEAKVMFLQDDEKWDEAHEVLKDCVSAIPESVYCSRRLANIRSSAVEDKLFYGMRCFQIKANDPLCLMDVALALHSKGDFTKAKEYFEMALRLPGGSEGYNKEYILYQYAITLEASNMHQKAKDSFVQACQLKMKSACEKLKLY